MPGDTGPWRSAALQVKGARQPLPRYAPLKIEGTRLLEVGTAWAPFGDAWGDLGGRSELIAWSAPADAGLPLAGGSLRWVCCSMSEDPTGRETRALLDLLRTRPPEGLLADAPVNYAAGRLGTGLRALGFTALGEANRICCTHFGDVTARVRFVSLWARSAEVARSWTLSPVGQPCTEARGLCQLWREAGRPPVKDLYLNDESGTLTIDHRVSTTGTACSHWRTAMGTPLGAAARSG